MWHIAIGECKVGDLHKVLIECILTTTTKNLDFCFLYLLHDLYSD